MIGPWPYPGSPYPGTQSPDELQREVERYRQAYGQLYPRSQGTQGNGIYVKVRSYDEVQHVQCPADGKPIMIFDEEAGRLYSKKFENGNVYITGFRLVPLESSQPDPQSAPDVNSLIERMSYLERRMDEYESSGLPASKAENVKPSGV